MSRRRALAASTLALALLAAVSGGCSKTRPQYLVKVQTDASIPQLGDRVRIDLLTEDGAPACDDCSREVAVDPSMFPLSFGIVAPTVFTGTNVRVRTRLFRKQLLGAKGDPRSSALIDIVGSMPAFVPNAPIVPFDLPELYVQNATVYMISTCFGVAADLPNKRSCALVITSGTRANDLRAPEQTLPKASNDDGDAVMHPGEIAEPLRVRCTAKLPPGVICHPGDIFIVGDELAVGVDSDYPFRPEVLRAVGTFGLDVDEMKVGTVRALIRDKKLPSSLDSLELRVRDRLAGSEACTYMGPDNPINDNLPLNCVSRKIAGEICELLGKRLPTEVQWEFAARNGTAQSTYPWGEEPPTCERAVLSRGRSVGERGEANESRGCRAAFAFGPVRGGAPGDVTRLGVKNLGGNLAEWTADSYQDYTESCWATRFGLVPTTLPCFEDSTIQPNTGFSIRGGSWARAQSSAAGYARFAGDLLGQVASPSVGFRCAMSDGL